VVKGEDLFGIALRYGLTVAEIKAANPDVNPNFLSIGTVLIIPGSGLPEPTAANPSPTPFPLQLSAPDCWNAADGSRTCFVLAHNPGPGTLENLAVRMRSGDEAGETLEREAYAMLNLLPAGQSLPLMAIFPAELAPAGRASADLLRAYPLPEGDSRYLPLEARVNAVDIAADGLSAALRGEVYNGGDAPAQTAWLAAWALDSAGRVVAARRWEAPAPLAPGATAPFELTLYSLGGPIAAVHTLAEARP